MLFELMAGGLRELRAMGATLVGGHTIEGPTPTIGYTLLGDQVSPPRTKSALRPGDRLVLTKPLGREFCWPHRCKPAAAPTG